MILIISATHNKPSWKVEEYAREKATLTKEHTVTYFISQYIFFFLKNDMFKKGEYSAPKSYPIKQHEVQYFFLVN